MINWYAVSYTHLDVYKRQLEVRDATRMAEDIWQRAQEDSLRGLFLRELRRRWKESNTEEEREQVTRAARFGLAALDHRDRCV